MKTGDCATGREGSKRSGQRPMAIGGTDANDRAGCEGQYADTQGKTDGAHYVSGVAQ